MVVIDSNNVCWQAFHSLPELSVDKSRTEVAFGFMLRVLKLAEIFPGRQLIFCWDSNSWRRKRIFPEYKHSRTPPDPERRRQKEVCRAQMRMLRNDVLPLLGFRNNFLLDGYESDDLMAAIAYMNYKKYEIIIVTTDEDLYQCIRHGISIYNLRENKPRDINWFRDKYGCEPWHWDRVKAIAGCSSDCIPGVPGVGEKTAIKYLRGQLDSKTKKYQDISKSRDIIDRNQRLVGLPFSVAFDDTYQDGISRYRALKIRSDRLTKRKFIDTFSKYHFHSLLKEFSRWESGFDL